MVSFWWVAQGRSKNFEVVWAPLYGKGGRTVPHWARLEHASPGDMVVHYANGHVVGVSQVRARAHEARPPSSKEAQWAENGLFLPVDFALFDTPLPLSEIPHELRAPAGPSSPFDVNHGVKQAYFFAIPSELAQFILDHHGLELLVVPTRAGNEIVINGATDRDAITKVRAEQSRLRASLLQRSEMAGCGICGILLPSRYLHAAHIKKRASASERERRDLNNTMLACTLGCDAAFEHGDIWLDPSGVVSVSQEVPADLRARLEHVRGKQAPSHNSGSAPYFEHHRQLTSGGRSRA